MTKLTHILTILACTFVLSMTLGCGKDASEATVSSVCESIEEAYASMDDKFEMDKCRKHTNLVKGKVGKKGFVTFAECIYEAGTKSEVGACGQKALADAKEAGLGGNIVETAKSLQEKACACTDKECAQGVVDETKDLKGKFDGASDEEKKEAGLLIMKMVECVSKHGVNLK
jgi:hypothetical protein